jgi:hypothetical protein
MTVHAEDEEEAKDKADSQLNKPGRQHIRKRWRQQGKRVKEMS